MIEIDTHNFYALMEERATHLALLDLHPGKRPFIIGRGTFPSAGKWMGHWLGDNFSRWTYLHYSIQGILQFQLFQIPMVGADVCGFNGNSNEELCNRWSQLGAFYPFYRNHNTRGAVSQEPYRWDSVAKAATAAINVRYSLLNYWVRLLAPSNVKRANLSLTYVLAHSTLSLRTPRHTARPPSAPSGSSSRRSPSSSVSTGSSSSAATSLSPPSSTPT